MTLAKNGDTVKVHYTGKLADGTQFDSSVDREPLEFALGEEQVIQGFDQAVIDMAVGDKKSVDIACDQAYGPHREELIIEVDKGEFPDDLKPEVGQKLQLNQPNGTHLIVVVSDVTESAVTLDANHPLAGKDLTFDIELVSIG